MSDEMLHAMENVLRLSAFMKGTTPEGMATEIPASIAKISGQRPLAKVGMSKNPITDQAADSAYGMAPAQFKAELVDIQLNSAG